MCPLTNTFSGSNLTIYGDLSFTNQTSVTNTRVHDQEKSELKAETSENVQSIIHQQSALRFILLVSC